VHKLVYENNCNFCLPITARSHNMFPYKTTAANMHTAFLVFLSSGSKTNSIFLPVGPRTQYLEHPFLFPFYNSQVGMSDLCVRGLVFHTSQVQYIRLCLKCDRTHAETRFYLLAKWTSPFKSAGASYHATTGSRGVQISGSNGSNVGYTMFQGSVKSTGYPLHSSVSSSLPLLCVTVCHHISTGLYLPFSLLQPGGYFIYQQV
jgi:hypothetical protein